MFRVVLGLLIFYSSTGMPYEGMVECKAASADARMRYNSIERAAKEKLDLINAEVAAYIKKEDPGIGTTYTKSGESFHNLREFLRERKAEALHYRAICVNQCSGVPDNVLLEKRMCLEQMQRLADKIERDYQAAGQQLTALREAEKKLLDKLHGSVNLTGCKGDNCGVHPMHDIHNPKHPYHYPGRENITAATKVEERDLAAVSRLRDGESRAFQVEYNGESQWVTVSRRGDVLDFDWDRGRFLMDQRENGFAASGTQYHFSQYLRSMERSPGEILVNYRYKTPVPGWDD